MWKVYMIRCSDGSLYTGITTDIKRRLKEHNSNEGARYTRGRTPIRLVYLEECSGQSHASKREIEIKKMSRNKKWVLIKRKPLVASRDASRGKFARKGAV
jgi:putative endonuclease